MAASAVLPEVVTPIAVPAKPRARRGVMLLLLTSLLILSLGAVEDLYGNTDRGDIYGSDAVQYLDIARAFQQHDFHSALNPLWSQGYPALLAAARPLFAAGPVGDWHNTRAINFAIFTADYLAFLFLLTGLFRSRSFTDLLRSHSAPKARLITARGETPGTASEDSERAEGPTQIFLWSSALAIFFVTQVCIGQVSHVNPDELVTTLFFVACGLLVRILNVSTSKTLRLGALLGLTLGLGFIAKAVFLVLGSALLAFFALALFIKRRKLAPVLAAATIFVLIVGSYGAALSRAVGHSTLGEAGSINYAWHVNRLQKWVHWQGGVQPATEAWPKASIAHFAQWETFPPDFGTPVHPTTVLQTSPVVYGFAAPIHATYVPYFDPPYFYAGYHHLFRLRYQLIALVKNFGDLAQVVLTQPLFIAFALALLVLLSEPRIRRAFLPSLRRHWLLPTLALTGIAIYLPVHLEGRYLAGFLAVLLLTLLFAAFELPPSPNRLRVAGLLLLLGFTGSLIGYQLPAWRNLARHTSPSNNIEWLRGQALLAQHLPSNAQIGVIHWTPNLQSDWAYIAHVQITSEIASPQDMDLFWKSSPAQQQATLETFRRAGAVAVIAINKPLSAGGPSWQHLPNTDLWIYRF